MRISNSHSLYNMLEYKHKHIQFILFALWSCIQMNLRGTMKKLLLVEDDKNISDAVTYYLKDFYIIDVAHKKKDALEKLNNYYDLALLDISLPDGTTFDISDKLKCPIIFLTAHDDEETIVKGLTIAEEYITKPFKNKELLLRIEKVLKRNNMNVIAYENVTIDLNANKILVDNKEIDSTILDFKILELFLTNIGKVITRDMLSDLIYDNTGNIVEENTMNVYVKRVRDKLGVDFIKTIRKVGFIVEKN